ncbi:hypothetical protein BT96DRAFT_751190, partial [Gymnopus androsaceus JB14]
HAKRCWGDEAVKAAQESKDLSRVHEAIEKFGLKKQSMLTAAFRTMKGWAESFSTTPPLKENIQYKEGCPDQYVPSKETVSRDVKHLFEKMKEKIAVELQDYNGEIPIALDCWTSPNHRAWMSIATSWLKKRDDGTEEMVTHLLDFMELPHSHSSENMAEAL